MDAEDPLAIYKSHFERAYLDATEEFYKGRAAQVRHISLIKIIDIYTYNTNIFEHSF